MVRAEQELERWADEAAAKLRAGSGPVWGEPKQSSDRDAALGDLLKEATHALYAEDRRLREAFDKRVGRTADVDRTARGLGYWVFEHNLVYAIFRAWLPLVDDIVWDEADRKRTRRTKGARPLTPAGRGTRFDLQVQLKEGPRIALEAKWWNGNEKKDREALEKDRERLLDACKTETAKRGILLTFWYGPIDGLEEDFKQAATSSKNLGLTQRFAGVFPTHTVDKEGNPVDGYFALVAYDVGARVAAGGRSPERD